MTDQANLVSGSRGIVPVTSDDRWPLHDRSQTRHMEGEALDRHPPHALMARAGHAVARLVVALSPQSARCDVVAGPGNNGGDGLVAARLLAGQGWQVRVRLVGSPKQRPADAEHALQQAQQAGVPITTVPWPHDPTVPPGVLVDALLGMGASRAPDEEMAHAISEVNGSRDLRLAVDLPSGLDGDTGRPLGRDAVRAEATLSLLTLKPGLFTGSGREFAGEVWFDALGENRHTPGVAWLDGAADARLAMRDRPRDSHKGSFGDVFAVGGAPGMEGALHLAASAALAAGAGRVHASPVDESARSSPAWPQRADARPELMLLREAWRASPDMLKDGTVVCGCGGGQRIGAAMPPLIAGSGRLVLDADALNALARDEVLARQLAARGRRGLPTVITPHPLEAARLLGCSTTTVQSDRLRAAVALSARFDAVVLLKGAGTVIAAPGELPTIIPCGHPALAGPGTGDVLAGWLAGLWAARADLDAATIARAAAWWHARAAEAWAAANALNGLSIRALELIEAMRQLPRHAD